MWLSKQNRSVWCPPAIFASLNAFVRQGYSRRCGRAGGHGGAVPTQRRFFCIVFLLFGLGLVSAGCDGTGFRPMYAASADGSSLASRLDRVHITAIPGRVGQIIRNELKFQIHRGGDGLPPAYRLDIALREKEVSTLVNREGETLSRTYTVTASFQLIDIKTNKSMMKGESYGQGTYDRFESIFSNVRSQIDAKQRAAKVVAQDIKSRLEASLAQI